jgi:hypothetical protein
VADTALLLGLAGIGGTLAASLSGNWVTLALDRRRQRREEEAERAQVREALRLVRADLLSAQVKSEAAAEKRHWWPWSESLTSGHIDQYRQLLARALDDPKAWTALGSAEAAMDKVVAVIVAYGETHGGDRPPLEGPLIDLMKMTADACSKAGDALLLAEAGLPLGPRKRRRLARRWERQRHGGDMTNRGELGKPDDS